MIELILALIALLFLFDGLYIVVRDLMKWKESNMKHHITKYKSDGKRFATSWLQEEVDGEVKVMSIQTIEL